jgi:hypothetical protein
VSALIRWYSLNGVPRGSKNGSGASIRMRSGRSGVGGPLMESACKVSGVMEKR